MTKQNICLIGCGKMGEALLRGWVAADIFHAITIIDPFADKQSLCALASNISVLTDTADLEQSGHIDIFLLAVKPQIMDQVCLTIKDLIKQDTLIVSIAAGKSLSYFEEQLGTDKSLIRTMPNTPAAIGQGMTVLCRNGNVSTEQLQAAESLYSW